MSRRRSTSFSMGDGFPRARSTSPHRSEGALSDEESDAPVSERAFRRDEEPDVPERNTFACSQPLTRTAAPDYTSSGNSRTVPDTDQFAQPTSREAYIPANPNPKNRSRISVRRPGAPPFRQSIPELAGTSSLHPFEQMNYTMGLKSAGYLESIDVSRKKIKTRFEHALTKENFPAHLESFLARQRLKKRGEFMIRFLGQESEVHSPYAHIYIVTLPNTTETIKCYIESEKGNDIKTTALWTHLRNVKNTSHWSCKVAKFWPVRVVFTGPGEEDFVPSTRQNAHDNDGDLRLIEDERNDNRDPIVKANTRKNSEIVISDPLSLQIPSTDTPPSPIIDPHTPRTPTILDAVKQVGVAVANSIPPAVAETISTRMSALKHWWLTEREAGERYAEEEYDPDAEERREIRRERRRARREREALELEIEEERKFKAERKAERRRQRVIAHGEW